MSITTKFGDKIVFLVNGKGAVMRVEGPAAVVDLDLDVDDLMDLQLSLIHISSPRDRSLSRMPSSA